MQDNLQAGCKLNAEELKAKCKLVVFGRASRGLDHVAIQG